MHKILLASFVLVSSSVFAQTDAAKKENGLFKKASGVLNKVKGGSGSLSNDEIVAGLKEALSVGATNSSTKLSALDGFFCQCSDQSAYAS